MNAFLARVRDAVDVRAARSRWADQIRQNVTEARALDEVDLGFTPDQLARYRATRAESVIGRLEALHLAFADSIDPHHPEEN